jgi:hypothetical protein
MAYRFQAFTASGAASSRVTTAAARARAAPRAMLATDSLGSARPASSTASPKYDMADSTHVAAPLALAPPVLVPVTGAAGSQLADLAWSTAAATCTPPQRRGQTM